MCVCVSVWRWQQKKQESGGRGAILFSADCRLPECVKEFIACHELHCLTVISIWWSVNVCCVWYPDKMAATMQTGGPNGDENVSEVVVVVCVVCSSY